MEMQQILEIMVKELVDLPDSAVINKVAGGKVIVFEVRADKNDIGKIIGRDGSIARALRTLMTSFGAKAGKRVIVEIIENEGD